MKVYYSITQKNPDFDKLYAEEYHFGEESENNQKINFKTTYKVGFNVQKCSIEKRIEYIYDIDKSINLSDVRILKCNEEAILVISNDLIKNVLENYDEKTNKKRIYFYLNPKAQFKHIGNLFLNEKEFEKLKCYEGSL